MPGSHSSLHAVHDVHGEEHDGVLEEHRVQRCQVNAPVLAALSRKPPVPYDWSV